MIYLIDKGVESEQSFKIMESVRKGKGLTPDYEKVMKEHDVPDWYLWSCKRSNICSRKPMRWLML